MTSTLFQNYLAVDWSANSTPKSGADSIWLAWLSDADGVELHNPTTRYGAMELITKLIDAAVGRTLIGFDFPFGYPMDAYGALGCNDWRDLWGLLSDKVEDAPTNKNNRFEVAAGLNTQINSSVFWGHPQPDDGRYNGLPYRKSTGYGDDMPSEKRLIETRAKGAKTVWQLNGAGSVGGQALLGIPVVNELRKELDANVWPFESSDHNVVFAEIYPSLWTPDASEAIKDAGQVKTVVQQLSRYDISGGLQALLDVPNDLPRAVREKEGWILGMGVDVPAPELPAEFQLRALNYERDPSAIYAASFATVRAEANVDRFDPSMQPLVTRLIHSCGMIEIADRLAFSKDAARAGMAAIASGAPILCDCEMVGAGIIRRYLPADNKVIVTLNDDSVPSLAKAIGNTRSAAAIELWRDHIGGAVVAIGNAPTALFHLLELLDQGWPKPACILGFPVGFIGAAESKAALASNPRGCDFVALRGRKGGSAMASAGVNALAAGLPEDRR